MPEADMAGELAILVALSNILPNLADQPRDIEGDPLLREGASGRPISSEFREIGRHIPGSILFSQTMQSPLSDAASVVVDAEDPR